MGLFNNIRKRMEDEATVGDTAFAPVHEPEAEEPVNVMAGITKEDIRAATATLEKYRQGKASYEQRIVDNEEWWKMNHWEAMRKAHATKCKQTQWKPTSAWTFNSVSNKHADAMDNYPEPNVLPREKSDQADAKALSEIIPVIMERSGFEQVYSDNWWYKLKHGACAYGVFWNSTLENGLGDIDVKSVDLLKLYWEPGITDIQASRNLFVVDWVDEDILKDSYPELADKGLAGTLDIRDYIRDDSVDRSGKAVVVDWYYRKHGANGSTVLHYVKFVGDEILFASENEPGYENGWYEDGSYPIVFDTLYPEAGTPVGFGIIDICKDPQAYIDSLSGNMLEMSHKAAKPRFWIKKGCGINREQFLDWNEPLVEVEGDIDEERVRQINLNSMDGSWMNLLEYKVSELKETSSNRDVSQGGSSGGITAASAIAALQEAGNKGSRDMIGGSYRCYTRIVWLVIERIRQFYDLAREFRVLASNQEYEFVSYSNAHIKNQYTGVMSDGTESFRRPVFDIVVKPQRRSTYSKLSQNELAKELYAMGVFNPAMAQQVLPMVQMMEFDGKEAVLEQIAQGQTLQKENEMLKAVIAKLSGIDLNAPQATPVAAPRTGESKVPAEQAAEGGAKAALTDTGKRIAEAAKPEPGRGGAATAVR